MASSPVFLIYQNIDKSNRRIRVYTTDDTLSGTYLITIIALLPALGQATG